MDKTKVYINYMSMVRKWRVEAISEVLEKKLTGAGRS
jgi:hypothetical protein